MCKPLGRVLFHLRSFYLRKSARISETVLRNSNKNGAGILDFGIHIENLLPP